MAQPAKTMRAQGTSECAATGRTITPGTLIFKSVLGWALFDAEAAAAVRLAVAEGRTSAAPKAVTFAGRPATVGPARYGHIGAWSSEAMDDEYSPF